MWQSVTAHQHTKLGDYEGYFVAWQGNGAHVSLPAHASLGVTRFLLGAPIDAVQSSGFWQEFAAARGLSVIGPSTHTYLDADPGPVAGVITVDTSALAPLQALVDEEDWAESGWKVEAAPTFALYEGEMLVAASNLNDFDDLPRDIGVLVAPDWRGRGLAEVLGQHAASYAVREHGFARWCARNTKWRRSRQQTD